AISKVQCDRRRFDRERFFENEHGRLRNRFSFLCRILPFRLLLKFQESCKCPSEDSRPGAAYTEIRTHGTQRRVPAPSKWTRAPGIQSHRRRRRSKAPPTDSSRSTRSNRAYSR